MKNAMSKLYKWAVVGAGPAGLASAGILMDLGVKAEDIILFDPKFNAGDLGTCWGEVNSNTSVDLFLKFLTEIKSFQFEKHTTPFPLEQLPIDDFCQLKEVAKPLAFVSEQMRKSVASVQATVDKIEVKQGSWSLTTAEGIYQSEKVIVATGSKPRTLHYDGVSEIDLETALKPEQLKEAVENSDTVAVFGSSHSSMIIIKNLLDAGVKKVINFYLSPHRYAVNMGDWTLYDNTGLKGKTAKWVRDNISKHSHPQVERYISNDENLNEHMSRCDKAVYAIGFKPRELDSGDIPLAGYDKTNGIIAPGLFGVGLAYPQVKKDPFGNSELSVGLYKFMNDIRSVMPLWLEYGL
jgi:thioredoxin reductase